MAKKKVKQTIEAPTVADYKPRLCLDLEGKQVNQIEGLKVGETAEFCVRGKIVGLEQRDRTDETGKNKTSGSIQLESYQVETMEDEENEFEDLAKDD